MSNGQAGCRLWVKERVIPSDRQNIAKILVRARMKEYDEMRLMELSKAKSGQDSMYIRELDEIPLSLDDFTCFAQKNIIDSSECCSMLDCSRQNLAYLISKDVKGNLFLKGEVIRCR